MLMIKQRYKSGCLQEIVCNCMIIILRIFNMINLYFISFTLGMGHKFILRLILQATLINLNIWVNFKS